MTVHMVRLFSEFPDDYTLDQIQKAVQDWVDRHPEWTEDNVEHAVTDSHPNHPDSHTLVVIRGDFRFQWSGDFQSIMDDAENTLQNYVAWYRLVYHECTADELNDKECSWDTSKTREYGTVPDSIPDYA